MGKTEIRLIILSIVGGAALISLSAHAVENIKESRMKHEEIQREFSTDHLTPLQKKVTLEGGTERPFKNEYWDNKAEGIYVDIIDGTPLFTSIDKYKSGTGWPSFTRPIEDAAITEHEDNTLFMRRVEIKAAKTGSHLGHVFTDGPKDAGGLRYCMNSAALRFVPKTDLEKEGYGAYLKLFETK